MVDLDEIPHLHMPAASRLHGQGDVPLVPDELFDVAGGKGAAPAGFVIPDGPVFQPHGHDPVVIPAGLQVRVHHRTHPHHLGDGGAGKPLEHVEIMHAAVQDRGTILQQAAVPLPIERVVILRHADGFEPANRPGSDQVPDFYIGGVAAQDMRHQNL